MDSVSFSGKIKKELGINSLECYQCGKCTAGCPMASHMDLRPNVIMRMIQLGSENEVNEILKSQSIWYCLTCETCYSRCPMSIDLPKIMDYLRELSVLKGMIHPEAKKIVAFHESFVRSIQKNGRVHELGMMIDYKLKSKAYFQDISLAPGMLLGGKLHLLPSRVKDMRLVKRAFAKRSNH